MTINSHDVHHLSSRPGTSGIALDEAELARIAAVLNRSSTHLHDDPTTTDVQARSGSAQTAGETHPRPDARSTSERPDVERVW